MSTETETETHDAVAALEAVVEKDSQPLDTHHTLRVLISGTASGIGRETARYFLERGHEVCGIDIQAASIDNHRYQHFVADVRQASKLPELPWLPEIVISNAGVQASGHDIDTNLKGALNLCEKYCFQEGHPQQALRSCVLVGSSSGHTGAEFPAYAASKGGVLAYAKNLAQRLAPKAVCNSIDPGGVIGELNRPVIEDPKLLQRIMELTPLKRWATEQEIATWIYFVSVHNRFMTGQNLLIDGGEAGSFDFVWPHES
ncbi:MAG: SDR family NAD(P)-dependent oxidoreductase [Atopobiaceae bacterium]|jgi:NAD(P)-dependent dehydrogenase (short-subunit alcohol dehydrogenase family)